MLRKNYFKLTLLLNFQWLYIHPFSQLQTASDGKKIALEQFNFQNSLMLLLSLNIKKKGSENEAMENIKQIKQK